MGFSMIGLLICTSIYLPNLLYVIFTPKNVPAGLKDIGPMITIIERIGQVGCFITLVISKDNYQNMYLEVSLLMMTICVILYYALWIRYVVKGHDFLLLFKPLVFLPIPMAIFPVLAFGFAAIWGKSILLGIFVVLLSIGHFANSWHTYKLLKDLE